MATDAGAKWHKYFSQWPSDVPRRGVLVTVFEQIPFESFAHGDELLLIERRAPDTLGARAVLVAYEYIQAVKIVDVVKTKSFQALGFTAPAPRK